MVGGFLFLVCFAEDSVRCSMVGGNFSSLGSIWTVQINPLKRHREILYIAHQPHVTWSRSYPVKFTGFDVNDVFSSC